MCVLHWPAWYALISMVCHSLQNCIGSCYSWQSHNGVRCMKPLLPQSGISHLCNKHWSCVTSNSRGSILSAFAWAPLSNESTKRWTESTATSSRTIKFLIPFASRSLFQANIFFPNPTSLQCSNPIPRSTIQGKAQCYTVVFSLRIRKTTASKYDPTRAQNFTRICKNVPKTIGCF